MVDPIVELFGVSALELFRAQRFAVSHGPLERIPAFMRSGAMASTDALCRAYTGPLDVASGNREDGVQIPLNDAHPSVLLRLGLTVYFRDLRRVLPEATALLRRLESALGLFECITISAFANAKGSGLPLHHDRYDQLLFQLRGEKRFVYAENGYVSHPDVQFSPYAVAPPGFGSTYRHGFPLTSQELIERGVASVQLRPGTVVFMPAGLWHSTADQLEDALSITVTVRAPTRLEVVQSLISYYAGQEPSFRAPSYGGFAKEPGLSEEEHGAVAELVRELGSRLPSLPVTAAYAAHLVHGAVHGTLSDYPAGERFARYVRLPNSSARFEDDPTLGKLRCIVKAGPTDRPQTETVLAFHPEARAIVDWILGANRAFSVDELALRFDEFPRDEIESLLSWLGRGALIRPLPVPEWDVGSAEAVKD